MYETVYSTAESRYEQYEKQSHSKYNRRCIDNSVVGCSKCVGYCQYDVHPGFLTAELRKKHNCIGKQCFHYVAKQKKKHTPQLLIDLTSSVFAMVREVMGQNEFTRVIRVENAAYKKYNAFYVSITNDCDFDGYSTQLMSEHGIDVAFINLNYDFDKCVALLCAN